MKSAVRWRLSSGEAGGDAPAAGFSEAHEVAHEVSAAFLRRHARGRLPAFHTLNTLLNKLS